MSGPSAAVARVRSAVRADLVELPSGSLVLVACSGGADSLALATAALFEAPRCGLRVGLVTVDHGWLLGSAQRAAELAAWAGSVGFEPAEVLTAAPHAATEGAGREARYAVLDEAVDRLGASAMLLGHSRNDQAETVLLGLARGSGARSLAGMPARRGPYRRPLLGVPRATNAQVCQSEGLTVWQDPANQDPAHLRVRVRHELLPVLEHVLGPGTVEALARTAALLADDADALDDATTEALTDPAVAALAVTALAALPRALRTRVLRSAAIEAGARPGALSSQHLGALEALVSSWHGQGPVDLPGLVSARRVGGRIGFASLDELVVDVFVPHEPQADHQGDS